MNYYIRIVREFGFSTLIYGACLRALRKSRIPDRLCNQIDLAKHPRIVQRLQHDHADVIMRAVDRSTTIHSEPPLLQNDVPIRVFWQQGEVFAPPLVKACIDSVRGQSGGRPVFVVTEDNVNEYVVIPEHVWKRFRDGCFSITHLSDIVRFALLSQRGGSWMDATICQTAPFPSEAYNLSYYTLRGPFGNWPWTDFLQSSGENNPFCAAVFDVLCSYWADHTVLVTHLLIDCSMKAVYECSPECRAMVDAVPTYGTEIIELNDRMLDLAYSQSEMDRITSAAFIHKLSYKCPHEVHRDSEITFYGHLLEGVKAIDTVDKGLCSGGEGQ